MRSPPPKYPSSRISTAMPTTMKTMKAIKARAAIVMLLFGHRVHEGLRKAASAPFGSPVRTSEEGVSRTGGLLLQPSATSRACAALSTTLPVRTPEDGVVLDHRVALAARARVPLAIAVRPVGTSPERPVARLVLNQLRPRRELWSVPLHFDRAPVGARRIGHVRRAPFGQDAYGTW